MTSGDSVGGHQKRWGRELRTERHLARTKIGDLAKTSKETESKNPERLAVLARCFQLQDALVVLELGRVLDASPVELDQHRLALRAARQHRLELIAPSTERLMARMDGAGGTASTKVLLHPTTSRAVVDPSNHVATGVVDFHGRLGIERSRQSLEARRWADAAAEVWNRVLETGAEGGDAARRLGNWRHAPSNWRAAECSAVA